jgi:hypothetical protein
MDDILKTLNMLLIPDFSDFLYKIAKNLLEKSACKPYSKLPAQSQYNKERVTLT